MLAGVAAAGSGCASMNNTDKGALAGGAFGTAAGAVVGAATHHPLLGAVVGGATGTAVGAVAGNAEDKAEARQKDAANAYALAQAQQAQQRLGIADIIGMTRSGQSDVIIINQIRTTRSTFQLTASDLDMLKQNGVSDRVIAEMQAARAAPPVFVQGGPPPTVIYDQPAVIVRPAPVYYAGGGYYYRRW
jgi:hypothetical protein